MVKNHVAEYRKEYGFTQVELARRTGIAPQNLSAIERGTLAPWPKARRAIARVLKSPQSELFPEGGATDGR